MELLHLRYFMTVAKYENFSKAADELYISQPSISKAVLSLEKELGMQLFTRKGKRVQLNEAGLALKQRLEPVMSTLDALPQYMKAIAGQSRSTVVLNVLAASPLLPDLLMKFKEGHPLVDFQLFQDAHETQGNVSIRTSLPDVVPENSRLVLKEEILLAVPMTSPLALKESVRLRDLRRETFITMSGRSPMRDISDYYFDSCGFTPHVGFESDDPNTTRGLVSAGLGISMWPEVTWGRLGTNKARLIRISDPLCHRSIYVSCADRSKLNAQTQLFLDFLTDYFKNLSRQRMSSRGNPTV